MSALSVDWPSALRAQLKAGLILAATIAGTRVESEQNDPIAVHPSEAATQLPKICAYLPEEDSTGTAGLVFKTTARVQIDVWASGVSETAPPRTAQEVAADSRDKGVAQVLKATVLNSAWVGQFERAVSFSVKRGVATTNTALVLAGARIDILVGFTSQPELRPPEEIFETFTMDAHLPPAADEPDLGIIAQPPQEAT